MENENAKYFLQEFILIAVLSISLWFVFSAIVYPLLGFASTAPMPVRTLAVLALVVLFIRRRSEKFSEFGLKQSMPIWLIVLLVITFFAVKLFLVQPLADVVVQLLSVRSANTSVFSHIEGNTAAYIGWLLIAIGVGGFAEEFIFRGYLIKRIADLFENRLVGIAVALIVQAVIFGAMHFYVGFAGVVSATTTALAYGCFYLLSKRSLIPVMIVHALWDSLIFTLIYLGGGTSI